jgi:hypothetical protein
VSKKLVIYYQSRGDATIKVMNNDLMNQWIDVQVWGSSKPETLVFNHIMLGNLRILLIPVGMILSD